MLKAVSSEPQSEGKHRILAHLGQGGTANVYLAVAQGPSGFNKLVVLKVLKENLQADSEFAEMFLNEARLAARLNHPNIVQTYEVVEENGVSMMVMEYLEGRPLSALLQRARGGELPLAVHLRIIADTLTGLHYAHELKDFDGTPFGVVHRDATPHNVFITFDGQIKVLDFGIAKLDVSTVETRAGLLKGKIRYMAPEQIRCQPVDRRADIYSAGVMLWHAAAGQPLWRNVSEASIVARVMSGELPPPSSVNPDTNPHLEQICLKAMAHDRDQRHATAAELEAELEALIAEIGGRATSRDAGKVVSRLFADVRDSTRMMIEQQLSASASMTWTGRSVSGTIPLTTVDPGSRFLHDVIPSLEPSSSTSTAPTLLPPVSMKRDWRVWALASSVVLLLFFLVLRLTGNQERAARAPAATPSVAQAASPAAAPAAPAPVLADLSIRADPPQAKLFLDDKRLPSNPYTGKLALDRTEHVVRAEAPGYVSSSRKFLMSDDIELSLELERVRSSGAAAGRRVVAPAPIQRGPRKAAGTASAAATSGPSCETPFFIDQNGIKRVLPECM